MRLLFAITILCFCVVLWVALALARRIRLNQLLIATPKLEPKAIRLPAVREFFEAGEFRTPRPLHLDQEIFQQKPRRPLAEINSFSQRPLAASHPMPNQGVPGRGQTSGPIPIRPTTAYATLFGQKMSIAQIESYGSPAASAPSKSAPQSDGIAGVDDPNLPADFGSRRIPPQPERASGLRRRIDLSHFNKDLGDLTDPYTSPLRGSGTEGPAPTDNRFGYQR